MSELIKPRREAAKKKLLDETRQEALDSAIAKVTMEIQTRMTSEREGEDGEGELTFE